MLPCCVFWPSPLWFFYITCIPLVDEFTLGRKERLKVRFMDFLNLWKKASIILTGAIGILGLLKDFNNKSTDM